MRRDGSERHPTSPQRSYTVEFAVTRAIQPDHAKHVARALSVPHHHFAAEAVIARTRYPRCPDTRVPDAPPHKGLADRRVTHLVLRRRACHRTVVVPPRSPRILMRRRRRVRPRARRARAQERRRQSWPQGLAQSSAALLTHLLAAAVQRRNLYGHWSLIAVVGESKLADHRERAAAGGICESLPVLTRAHECSVDGRTSLTGVHRARYGQRSPSLRGDPGRDDGDRAGKMGLVRPLAKRGTPAP